MSGGFRKALGSLKDTTTVSLARINGGYKELDIAIVKATNHVERPPNEKYIRAIISAVSATRPRADVKYCIHALARRLSKTRNWAVALKALIVIHHALRDVDPTFHEELINYGKTRNDILNLARFKDDSSPEAWDYSAWIRAYALFLEEKLECFCALKYDVEMDLARTKELNIADLLEQLPVLQQLLYRVLCCQPYGTALKNFVIQLALSMVASESVKIYEAICDGVVNLVDKFFEMKRHDAVRALEIYRRSVQQAEKLCEFYEICKSLDVCRGETFITVDQPPASFVHAMEDYVKEAPRLSGFQKDQFVIHASQDHNKWGSLASGTELYQILTSYKLVADSKITSQKKVLAIEYRKSPDVEEARPTFPPQNTQPGQNQAKVETPVSEPPDLLSLDDPVPSASELEEKNVLPLTIFHASDETTSAPVRTSRSTGWELALFTEPSTKGNATTDSLHGGGLDKHTLDSLYNDAMKRNDYNVSYNPWDPARPIMQPTLNDPFHASHGLTAPQYVPMANQQQVSLLQQQQMVMMSQQQQIMMMSQHQQQPSNLFGNSYGVMTQQQQQPSNPFGNPYGASDRPYHANVHPQAYSPNTRFL